MSNFGKTWRIDGVIAAYITRGSVNGQYRVLIERCHANLDDIEAINWAHPTVELLREGVSGIQGLPEGYGFTLTDIIYDHGNKSYTVTVQVAEQYLGDVAGYISQVAELEDQVEAAQGQAAEAQALVQEANAAAEEARIQMESAQAQADDAKAQAEAAKAQAEEAQANVQAAEAAAAEKDATIAAQAQEIEALKADSGDAVVKSLEQAYEEGVESNG